MLSTALSTGLLLLCIACVVACYVHLDEVRKIQHRLGTMRSAVTGNTAELEGLKAQVQKLRGQFFAFKQAFEDGPSELFREADERSRADLHLLHKPLPGVCENYQRAQVDGPRSDAAKCECAYCEEMRLRRALARGELIPKTAAAQAARAKEASNNG